MDRLLLSSASHLYLVAGALYVFYFLRPGRWLALIAVTGVSTGVLLQGAMILRRFSMNGYAPVTDLGEALSMLGWLLALGFVAIERWFRQPSLGIFALPLISGLVLPAAVLRPEGRPIPPALQNAGMPVHVIIAFTGIALCGLAAGAAIAYLLLERQMKSKRFGVLFSRLPPLEVLDSIGDRLMKWGFAALSITLITGALFAKRAWGEYWRWDPKLVLTLAGWLVYAGLMAARRFAGWRGRRAAVMAMIGFAIVFGSFIGLKLFPAGLHTGDFQ